MDIKNVRTFVKVAELSNFTKASQELGYAQSTVTSQIQQLENELKVSLFDRHGKLVSLSNAGKEFLQYAYQMIQCETQAIDCFSFHGELKGELRIGIMETIAASKYSKIFQDFVILHPKVSLKLQIVTTHESLDYIQKGLLDFIFLLDEKTYQPNIVTAIETPAKIAFFCAPDSPLAKSDEICLDVLLQKPFILTEKGCNYRNVFETYLASQNKSLTCITEIGYTPYIIDAVKRQHGIGLLPLISLREAISKNEITLLNVTDYQLKMYIQVMYHKNKGLSHLMDAFLKYSRQEGMMVAE